MSESVSDLFGNLSLFCWLFAQAPQIIANYKNGSVEGLALPFLLNWMLGDVTNLIGCILTDQLDFQKHLATFFCMIDVILMGQYLYYTRVSPSPAHPLPPLAYEPHSHSHTHTRSRSRYRIVPATQSHSATPTRSPSTHSVHAHLPQQTHASDPQLAHARDLSLSAGEESHGSTHRRSRMGSKQRTSSVLFLSVFALVGFNLHSRRSVEASVSTSAAWAEAMGDRVSHEHVMDWERLVGRVSAWACAILYFTSRLPQCWLNFRRKSCEGLSMLLFAAAFLGNTTYVVSILTSSALKHDPGFLSESAPYLIGSGGTVGFDLTILFQAYLYRHSAPEAISPIHRKHSRRSPHHHSSNSRSSSVAGSPTEEMHAPLLSSEQQFDAAEQGRGRPAWSSRLSLSTTEALQLAKERSHSRRNRQESETMQATPTIAELPEGSPRNVPAFTQHSSHH